MNVVLRSLLLPLLLIPAIHTKALNVKEDIGAANCLYYRESIYLYGFEQKKEGLALKIVRYSTMLQKQQEASIILGNEDMSRFHPITVDTVHHYLSFVVQRIDNDKTARLIRFTKELHTVASIKDAEVSRINFAAFDEEKLYGSHDLLLIRPGSQSSKDSAHFFFLQKYRLLDSSRVFEYKLEWEFGFDKNKYKRCHLITFNQRYVFVYANVISGIKKGQWVLMINMETGEFERACQLNTKNDPEEYLFSSHDYNPANGELSVAGVRLNTAGSGAGVALGKMKMLNSFVCTIDSLAVMKEKKTDFIPVPAELSKEKELKKFLVKTNKLLYKKEEYVLISEILAEEKGNMFKTYGFLFTQLVHDENGNLKTKSAFFNPSFRDPNISQAKQLVNSYELSSAADADKLCYQSPIFGVFSPFVWDLAYTDKAARTLAGFQNKTTGKITFYSYSLSGGKWENKELTNGEKNLRSKCILLSTKQYLVFNQATSEESKVSSACSIELREF